jgi:uncharacterized protein YndB with AHSA1/START domain
LREGGAFSSRMEAKDGSMGFDFAGTYTKIVEHKLIEYSFGDRMAQVEFTPDAKGVVVRVTFDSEPTHSIEQQPFSTISPATLNPIKRNRECGDSHQRLGISTATRVYGQILVWFFV